MALRPTLSIVGRMALQPCDRRRQSRWVVALAVFMTAIAMTAVSIGPAAFAGNDSVIGPFGPEGPRMREQFWMLPSGEPGRYLRATVFRPKIDAENEGQPRPVVVINHGTSASTRMAVSMPVYYWLSRWFVERGYVVVLPQRRGHGATGGPLSEGMDSCGKPNHYRAGLAAADDIAAVVSYFQKQPFVSPSDVVVAGISSGGWAALAYASRNPKGVQAVVNFAGGRGAYAGGIQRAICGRQLLIETAGRFGKTARVPTVWFYASNDSYFEPKLANTMAKSWSSAGGAVKLHSLPAYGQEGHNIANDRAGWNLWGGQLDVFLESARRRDHKTIAGRQGGPPEQGASLASYEQRRPEKSASTN